MKVNVYDLEGKEKSKIDLPKCFSAKIREDIVAKVLAVIKKMHPYAPSPGAGKQTSARGKIRHRRHVWQTHYGRGMSRIPRKVMSKRGSQFNWEGAGVPQARGGMRAHPPKTVSKMILPKINRKEMKIAFDSAISATANKDLIVKKYQKISEIKDAPFIVDSKFSKLKTKEMKDGLKKILGDVFEVAEKKRKQRSGKGKSRNRRYKKSAGVLIVVGEEEEIKTKIFDVVKANQLNLLDLAQGGLGRLVIYTEEAIKEIKERIK